MKCYVAALAVGFNLVVCLVAGPGGNFGHLALFDQ